VLGNLGLCLHDLFPDDFAGDLQTVRRTIGPGPGPLSTRNGNCADDPANAVKLAWQWADELEAPAEPDWIWNGYLAPGSITLLAGKPKSGKSTLACGLAEALNAGVDGFLEQALRKVGVIYLSEEGAGTLKPKLTGRIRTLTRDGAWPRPSWAALITAAIEEANRVGATVIIVDSLSFWSSLGEGQENDSAVMQGILGALIAATSSGLAVVLVHHQRKGGGEDGDAVRGSGAIFAAVDMLIEVERAKGDSTHRQLVATGRWRDAPPVLIVAHDPRERSWRVIGEAGDRDAAGELGIRDRILESLPSEEPGVTENELVEVVEIDKRKVSGPLRKLVAEGAVMRAGEGRAYHPFRYWRNTAPNTAPDEGSVGRRKSALSFKEGRLDLTLPLSLPSGQRPTSEAG
jgi:AAA domain